MREMTMEHDYIEQPGEPDVKGAIEKLELMRENDPENWSDIDDVLERLRPSPVKTVVGEQYDHRGHWHHALGAIFFKVPGIKGIFQVLEAWAYDIKPVTRVCVGGTTYDRRDGPIEIWGRLLLRTDPAQVLLDESSGSSQYFDLMAGDSEFLRCKAKRIQFDSVTSVGKVDFKALRSENFGYSVK